MKSLRKFLFVVICLDPTLGIGKSKRADEFATRVVPLGPLSIISYCKKYVTNYECEFSILEVDIDDEYKKDTVVERLNEFKPDIVGFSVLYNDFCPAVFELAGVVKDVNESIFVVAGGVGISDTYDEFLSYTDDVDAICFSEGELPISAFLNADDLHEFVKNHKSWLTPETVKNDKKPAHDLLDDINEIPPFYDLFDIKRYASKTMTRGDSKKINSFTVMTTRGCPYNCNFCSVAHRGGKKVRVFSAERVISDIKAITNVLDIDLISFRDDQFLLDKKRAIEILKNLSDLGIMASFDSGVNASLIDEEIVYWFKQANVTQVAIAIESGSERMLKDIIQKPLKLEQVKPVVELLRKYEIVSTGNFICGVPGETPQDRELTEKFIEDIGFGWLSFYVATPLKGSRLYDVCLKEGYIKKDTDIFARKSLFEGVITAPYIDPVEITRYVYHLNLKYNFIRNYDYLHGNYEKAAVLLERVSNLYPFHAISHYCLANTYEKLGNKELRDKYMSMYKSIIDTAPEWREHAITFGLDLNPII